MISGLQKLHLWTDEKGISLPSWASFYLRLGVELAEKETTAFVAILTPTRRMAAVLMATGFVCERVSRSAKDPKTHFETLEQVGPGTPVSLLGTLHSNLDDGRRYDGLLCQNRGDIAVRTREGTRYSILTPKRSLSVEPLPETDVDIPEHSPRGYKVNSDTNVVESILLSVPRIRILMRSKVECSIIGTKSFLEEEMEDTKVAVRKDGKLRKGKIEQIVKPRKTTRKRKNYWSDIFTFYGEEPPNIPSTSSAIIFDGVTAFRNWHDVDEDIESHRVAVLRRNHGSFGGAIDLIRNKSFRREKSHPIEISDVEIPPGVEVIAFK
jgi:hypothetical protein